MADLALACLADLGIAVADPAAGIPELWLEFLKNKHGVFLFGAKVLPFY